jgi:glutathione S-transferase
LSSFFDMLGDCHMRALLFTPGSPYARGIRILLDELGLDYEEREVDAAPTPAEAAGSSPTLQVPTLWDGSVKLWDSTVISEYLLSTYPERADTHPSLAMQVARPNSEWEDRLLLATVQTLGTSITTISQMTWSGVFLHGNTHLARCAERLPTVLGWLEKKLAPAEGFMPGSLAVQDIFLACYLRFAEKRPLGLDLRLDRFPKISALLGRLDERTSFRRNPIRWWDPDVIAYAEDGLTPLYGESGRPS